MTWAWAWGGMGTFALTLRTDVLGDCQNGLINTPLTSGSSESCLGHAPVGSHQPLRRCPRVWRRSARRGSGRKAGLMSCRVVALPEPRPPLTVLLHRLQPRSALFLRDLLRRAAGPPGSPRRAPVPAEVRPGLGQVLPARALPHAALRVLSAAAARPAPARRLQPRGPASSRRRTPGPSRLSMEPRLFLLNHSNVRETVKTLDFAFQ